MTTSGPLPIDEMPPPKLAWPSLIPRTVAAAALFMTLDTWVLWDSGVTPSAGTIAFTFGYACVGASALSTIMLVLSRAAHITHQWIGMNGLRARAPAHLVTVWTLGIASVTSIQLGTPWWSVFACCTAWVVMTAGLWRVRIQPSARMFGAFASIALFSLANGTIILTRSLLWGRTAFTLVGMVMVSATCIGAVTIGRLIEDRRLDPRLAIVCATIAALMAWFTTPSVASNYPSIVAAILTTAAILIALATPRSRGSWGIGSGAGVLVLGWIAYALTWASPPWSPALTAVLSKARAAPRVHAALTRLTPHRLRMLEDMNGASPSSAAADASFTPGAQARGVVLITIDTLRADHVTPRLMPRLSAFASHALSFERSYAGGAHTSISLPSIMWGVDVGSIFMQPLYRDIRHRPFFANDAEAYGHPVNMHASAHSEPSHTLAELVDGTTIAIVDDGHTGFFVPEFGLARGFDTYQQTSNLERIPKDGENAPTLESAQRALETLTTASSDPFFMWVHFMGPHTPWNTPAHLAPPDRTPYERDIFDTDAKIGALIDDMNARGMLEDTAVIITADHGEAFGEHGFEHHGLALYEEIIRVPFIIHTPQVSPRLIAHEEADSRDIAPTILDLLGMSPATHHQGHSLVAAAQGKPLHHKIGITYAWQIEPWSSQAHLLQIGAIDDGLKVTLDLIHGTVTCHDLTEDPEERRAIDPEAHVRRAEFERLMAHAWTVSKQGRVFESYGVLP